MRVAVISAGLSSHFRDIHLQRTPADTQIYIGFKTLLKCALRRPKANVSSG